MRRVTLALLCVVLQSRPVDACGGFFCSQVPVDQGGENIVFVVDGTTVTAHIQIRYVGRAEDFAWILPVPSEPAAPEVSTDVLFTNLGYLTQPQFVPTWDYSGCTNGRGYQDYPGSAEGDGAAADAGAGGGPPSVQIEFQGAVGPYDSVVLTSDSASAVQDWLLANGFDVPPQTAALIAPYVQANYHFVALKLQNDRDAGDIVPIKVSFAWDHPCVPLRLTAIAATANMSVRMWVFGRERSIPLNYRHVLIDEAKIDWLTYGGNYASVVTDAANEAEGRAFVTEYAGQTADLRAAFGGNLFYTEGQFDLDALAAITDPAAFVDALLAQGFPRTAQMQGLLRQYIPMPPALVEQGVTESEFYNDLWYWESQGALDPLAFDPVAFAADLDALVVTPLREAEALIDKMPYLTRLFTTISPDEMTEDPIFGRSAELPDVSNLHQADIHVFCDGTNTLYQIVLADGRTIWLDANDPTAQGGYDASGNVTVDEDPGAKRGTMARLRADLPGSTAALQLYEDREGVQVYDNGARIDDVLAAHNAAVLNGTPYGGGDGCACAVGASRPAMPALLLLALGLMPRRRRR
jgi:hypothetical protein